MFTSGADLKERRDIPESQVGSLVSGISRAFSQLEVLPLPVIAAIDGLAIGGGAEMALACDFRVASESFFKQQLNDSHLFI